MYPFRSGVKKADEFLYFTPDHTFLEILRKSGGVQIPLTEQQLAIIDQAVGSRDLFDIRRFLKNECCVDSVTDLNWDTILNELRSWLKRGKDKPKDSITLLVAVKDYQVSRATLKRRIANGDLKSYRSPKAAKNSPHLISRADLEQFYTQKP